MNTYFVGFMLCLFANNVIGKECDCGEHCKSFQGKIADQKCYYIAPFNSMNGEQYLVSNIKEEKLIVNGVLRGLTAKQDFYIATDNSYKTKLFVNGCHPINCTHTAYVSDCVCKLNIFEKIWSGMELFYIDYNILFWVSVVVCVLMVFLPILKCFICKT